MFKQRGAKKTGLNILIIGCGKVGTALTRQLCKEGHDITVIDKNADKVEMNVNQYDVMGICGNGASYSVLMEAGVENADLVIAVTNSDELNLLCCTIAKQGRDCATVARVRNPDYSKEIKYLKKSLGLTMVINPELETATPPPGADRFWRCTRAGDLPAQEPRFWQGPQQHYGPPDQRCTLYPEPGCDHSR